MAGLRQIQIQMLTKQSKGRSGPLFIKRDPTHTDDNIRRAHPGEVAEEIKEEVSQATISQTVSLKMLCDSRAFSTTLAGN